MSLSQESSSSSSSSTPNHLLPSEFDLVKVNALIDWLKTFPQFDPLTAPSDDSMEWLSLGPVARAVLSVTKEVLVIPAHDAATDCGADDVEAVWGQVFGALSTPKLLQKIAGRRLATGELRFVLVSCLLSTAIGDGCLNRVMYINRILQLSKETQHALMNLIEAFPKTPCRSPSRSKTPTKSPARSRTTGKSPATTTTPQSNKGQPVEAQTPRSSGSRRNLDHSFSSCIRMSTPARPRRSFSSVRSPQTEARIATQTINVELMALVSWIRTFPQMSGLGSLSTLDALHDMKVSLGILHVAEHLCGQQPSPPAYLSVEDVWAASFKVVALLCPSSAKLFFARDLSLSERQSSLLAALLTYALSDDCQERHVHVETFLSLSQDLQQRLKEVMKRNRSTSKGLSQSRESDLSEGVSRGSRRIEEISTTPSGYTPLRKRRSPKSQASATSMFSPSISDPNLDRTVNELKTRNQKLLQDLEKSTAREAELAIKMQELEMKVRRDMMRLESQSLRVLDEANEAHNEELTALREQLFQLQDSREREQKAHQEVKKLRDEMDLMEHSRDKLAETEEKLRKCRERLEQLADVRDCLKREEEAHSTSVEKCLRLENEIKSMQPLRRQLEEYKARAVEAEFQLIECQENLKRATELSKGLNDANEELVGGARSLKEEADVLRKKVSGDENDDCNGPSVAEGISEMNPHVKEELLRLRNENEQLREFAAKRSEDKVELLEQKLDDIQRLSDRFKDQYLSTKKHLELKSIELDEALEREEDLKEEITEWNAKWEELSSEANSLKQDLDHLKQDLVDKMCLLDDSMQREAFMREENTAHVKEKLEIKRVADQRMEGWNKTREELTHTLELLVDSQDREKNLLNELEEIETKLHEEQQKSAAFENELNLTFDALESTKSDLNGTIDRENLLRGELSNLKETKNTVERDLGNERHERERERMAAESTLNETRVALEEKAKRELDDLQTNMNRLLEEERLSCRTKIEKAQLDHEDFRKRSVAEIEELKIKMIKSLAAAEADFQGRLDDIKREYSYELERSRKKAEEDREKLLVKGKGMLRESKSKAEEIIGDLEDEVTGLKHKLAQLRQDKDDFEHKTRAKVSSYKHKLQFSMSRIGELSEGAERLEESIRVMEKEKSKLLDENERYRRQLGGRYGADGKIQNQMEMLQKEFNAVLEENRSLKKKLSIHSNSDAFGGIPEELDEDKSIVDGKAYLRSGVSRSTLSALREEYEEQLHAMNDEKRELMMRNSAAITDVQKAEQRSWELEKEVERLKQEITSTHLALQRAELQIDELKTGSISIQEQSFHTAGEYTYSENLISGPSDEVDRENCAPLIDLGVRQQSPPRTPQNVLSPSNRHNWNSMSAKKSGSIGVVASRPGENLISSACSDGPTLLDLTKYNAASAHDGQPECKQS